MKEEKIIQKLNSNSDNRNQVDRLFKDFENTVIPELKLIKSKLMKKKDNIYKMSNLEKLSTANAITRSFSTKLGLFWERLANLSPVVVSPEIDFGKKIEDVDIVVQHNKKLYYTQLKTQKNTLTGSQVPRTYEALSKYDNFWFVACINNDANWTAPIKLNRLLGEEFWNKIGMDYNKIINNLDNLVKKVENLL